MNCSLRPAPLSDSIPGPPGQHDADRLRTLICKLRWMGVTADDTQIQLATLTLRTHHRKGLGPAPAITTGTPVKSDVNS